MFVQLPCAVDAKKTLFLGVFTVIISLSVPSNQASADTFGDTFDIYFATIGNPGNPPDAHGMGSVDYTYRMGTYEISRDMIIKANRLGGLGITLWAPSGGKTGPDHPAVGISLNEAARFVNWLNTNQGFPPAYNFATQPGEVAYDPNEEISSWKGNPGYDPADPFRNNLTRYFLPSADEWYKAGYYDPRGVYYHYPIASDCIPAPKPNLHPSYVGDERLCNAVWGQGNAGPEEITKAGGLSPYGTVAQAGNVWEYLENSAPGKAGFRGGSWVSLDWELTGADVSVPANEKNIEVGFRVASCPSGGCVTIPEPGSLLLIVLGVLGLLLWRR